MAGRRVAPAGVLLVLAVQAAVAAGSRPDISVHPASFTLAETAADDTASVGPPVHHAGDAALEAPSAVLEAPSKAVAFLAEASEVQNTWQLTVNVYPPDGGQVAGDGVYCSGQGNQYTFREGYELTLAALPSLGYRFSAWQGCDDLLDDACWVLMTADKAVAATFVEDPERIPTLSLEPAAHDFGPVIVGESAGPVQFVVTNEGPLDAPLRSAALQNDAGLTFPAFALTHDGCEGRTLEPGGSCAFSVSFTPGDILGYSDRVVVDPMDRTIAQVEATVSGSGTSRPPAPSLEGTTRLEASEKSWDFGPVHRYEQSEPKTFRLTSTGDQNVLVWSVSVTTHGGSSAFPVLEEDCAARLMPPGDECAITVAFAPDVNAATEGWLTIASSTDGGEVTIYLSGEELPARETGDSGDSGCSSCGGSDDTAGAWLVFGVFVGGWGRRKRRG